MKPDLSIIPEPDRSTEKRKPLTRKEVLLLCITQEGRCGCGCGFKLEPMGEGVIDEHNRALELQGSNEIQNRLLFRKPCARKKTDEQDTPAIAKARRIEARETGTRRERKAIPGRGFGSMSRKMDGSIGLTKAAQRQADSGREG